MLYPGEVHGDLNPPPAPALEDPRVEALVGTGLAKPVSRSGTLGSGPAGSLRCFKEAGAVFPGTPSVRILARRYVRIRSQAKVGWPFAEGAFDRDGSPTP